jgi:hypothetical protein
MEIEVVEHGMSVDGELDDALLPRSNLLRSLQRVGRKIVRRMFSSVQA